ncbi:MAG: ParG [Dolichospermum sp.]
MTETVRARFKSVCALQNRTMDSVMEELILNWLEQQNPNSTAQNSKVQNPEAS